MAPGRSWVVLGGQGMLGVALAEAIRAYPAIRFVGLNHQETDITERKNIDNAIRKYEAQTIINCAAYTDVDGCEQNPMLAAAVNGEGARNVAAACAHANIPLVHVSTDFVFDGKTDRPYTETDATTPISVYGSTKLEGERQIQLNAPKHLIVRTAWTFGPGRPNFITKVIERGRTQGALEIPAQRGSPTSTRDLASGILALLFANAHGVFHVVNSGSCTRVELAQAALAAAGLTQVTVTEKPAEGAPPAGIAPRPAYSVLDTAAFTAKTGVTLPDWREAVNAFVATLAEPAN